MRTIPYGFLGVLFAVYLSQLGFSIFLIGIVLTLTTASSAVYTLIATLYADRWGRRRTLVFFALTDALAGLLLFLSSDWWAPVAAGIVGNMTVTTAEVGPYLSLDQAILPHTSDFQHRTMTFSLYNLVGYSAFSIGSLLAGIPSLLGQPGFQTYRPLFLVYLISGLFGALLYSKTSPHIEVASNTTTKDSPTPRRSYAVLSEKSKPTVFKLSTLFAIDAFGGGLVGTSIISYYFYTRYSLSLASLGILFAITQVITAMSLLVAARLANWIGLLKTMVYSHIPSNVLLAAIPFAPSLSIAIGLLFSRQSLSQMDVPTRQSYLASLVPKSDRAPAAGITNVSRTASNSVSPFLAGYIMESVWLGMPFALGGILKIVYDLLVYRTFRHTPVSEG